MSRVTWNRLSVKNFAR